MIAYPCRLPAGTPAAPAATDGWALSDLALRILGSDLKFVSPDSRSQGGRQKGDRDHWHRATRGAKPWFRGTQSRRLGMGAGARIEVFEEPDGLKLRVVRSVATADMTSMVGMVKAPARGVPRSLEDFDAASLLTRSRRRTP